MRIISGKYRGLRLQAPAKLPVRPTTDLAKESLFNILQNRVDLEGISVLDLFSGTGNITYEFASRGCTNITSVDLNMHCVRFIQQTVEKLKAEGIRVVKSDVFSFLKNTFDQFDLIFADPPYDLNTIPEIAKLVWERKLLKAEGMLIIEHAGMQVFSNAPGFVETRNYGNSSFSFFSPGE